MTAFGTLKYDLTACPSDVIGFQCDHRCSLSGWFVAEPTFLARGTSYKIALDVARLIYLLDNKHSDHFLCLEFRDNRSTFPDKTDLVFRRSTSHFFLIAIKSQQYQYNSIISSPLLYK